MIRLLPLLLLLCLFACRPDGVPTEFSLPLTETIYNQQRPDVVMVTDTFRFDSVAYRLDTLDTSTNVIGIGSQLKEVTVRATDIVLGRDSVRLALVRIGRNWPFHQPSNQEFADYLLITDWGRETLRFRLDQSNIGEIGRRTVFRVGERDYQLSSFDDSLSNMVIKPIGQGLGILPTAIYETTYRALPVVNLEGERHVIRHEKGKWLAIVFNRAYRWKTQRITELDSIFLARTQGQTKVNQPWQVEIVSTLTNADHVAKMVGELDIGLPVSILPYDYCRFVDCGSYRAFVLLVGPEGRIRRQSMPLGELIERLGGEGVQQ